MRTVTFSVVLLVLLTLSVAAQKKPSKTNPAVDVKSEIMKLEDENNRAIIAGDVKAIAKLYADDFIGIHAGGGMTDKKYLIEYYSGNGSAVSQSEETAVRVFDKTAVVTAINKYKIKAEDAFDRLRYTRVYVFRDNKWQIVSEHFTFIKGDSSDGAEQ